MLATRDILLHYVVMNQESFKDPTVEGEYIAAEAHERELREMGASAEDLFLAGMDTAAKKQRLDEAPFVTNSLQKAVEIVKPVEPREESPKEVVQQPEPTVTIPEPSLPVEKPETMSYRVPYDHAVTERVPKRMLFGYEAAQQLKLGAIVDEFNDQQGIPVGLQGSNTKAPDYDRLVESAFAGEIPLSALPKPRTEYARQKARQAIAELTDKVENDKKTDEWTERFFDLQATLLG